MNSDLARTWKPAVAKLAFAVMLAVATTIIANAPTPAFANRIAIVVNGTPITTLDVDRRTKLLRLQRGGRKPQEKGAGTAR